VTALTIQVSFRTARPAKASTHPPAPKPSGPSSMARRIALAHYVDALIERGELRDLTEAAERLGITTARITQVADLALLAPDIQHAVLTGQCEPRDRHLHAVGRHVLWDDQRRAFLSLFPHVTLGTLAND
jgi:hypothetical protein